MGAQTILPLIWLSILSYSFAFGQNLVPNSSFEELRNLPVKPNPKNTFEFEPSSGFIPYKENLKYWFAATETTPDLRITSQALNSACRRAYRVCDEARTGNICVGIITFLKNTTTNTYREYIQIKLIKPLIPNKKVYIEFWASKERQAKLVSNNLGVHFSMKKQFKSTEETLNLSPHLNWDSIVNQEQKEWVKISGEFIPDKPYRFLLIGNFFENQQTKVEAFENFRGASYIPPYAYYLIDDVLIRQDRPEEKLVFQNQEVNANEPIILKNIEFEFDQFELTDSSLAELEKLVQFLQDNPSLNIAIQGHTDFEGDQGYNQILSEKRANAVFKYLLSRKIEEGRLSFEGFGETIPISDNQTEKGRSVNRRVEFIIIEE